MNYGQYENVNLGKFQSRNKQSDNNIRKKPIHTEIICNYCKKSGYLVEHYDIRPTKQLQLSHQGNSKTLPSTGALRKA